MKSDKKCLSPFTTQNFTDCEAEIKDLNVTSFPEIFTTRNHPISLTSSVLNFLFTKKSTFGIVVITTNLREEI